MAKLRNWKVAHGLGWVCAVGGAAVCLGGVARGGNVLGDLDRGEL